VVNAIPSFLSSVSLSSLLSDKFWDTQLCPEDECKDSKCTEGLVSEIVEVVEGTIADLVDLEGVLSLSLAKQVVAIVDVSFEPLPRSDVFSLQLVWQRIVSKLDLLKSSCDGKCEGHGVFVKIDLCLSSLLKQLGICVPGILKLVSKL